MTDVKDLYGLTMLGKSTFVCVDEYRESGTASRVSYVEYRENHERRLFMRFDRDTGNIVSTFCGKWETWDGKDMVKSGVAFIAGSPDTHAKLVEYSKGPRPRV